MAADMLMNYVKLEGKAMGNSIKRKRYGVYDLQT